MQETLFLNKNIYLYQRRRHKLFRALAQADSEDQHYHCSPKQQLISLYETAANKENHISQLGYFIKHQLTCPLQSYTQSLIEVLWSLIYQRDGKIVAFIIYRISRKYPSLFWKCFNLLKQKLDFSLQNNQINKQIIILYTDLFLYGFPITIQDFQMKIFTLYKDYIIDLIVQYQGILNCNIFFSFKLQKNFTNNFNQWLEQEKTRVVKIYEKLYDDSIKIQDKIVYQKEDEVQSSNYELQLEKFQAELYHFANAANKLQWEFNPSIYKLKNIFELKKETKTFKPNYELSSYESSLYLQKKTNHKDLKSLKKHEMIRIQQNDAFINQIKLCSDSKQCVNLSGYFLQQMNLQNNREYLVEAIINDCYSYNNISYVLKILAQISQFEPSLNDYCSVKAKKICSSARMNTKYQKLLCQMTKYRLIDQRILLQYCQKIIKNQNSQTMKQVQSILQNMGRIVYYRSLSTHIKINALLDKLQTIIKTKLTHFSIQNFYQLKGLINYLRNHKNNTEAQTQQIAKIQIKEEQNYIFLLTKMLKMMKESLQVKVLETLMCGINQEQYLTSYYYACLLKDLNSPQIQQKVHQQTFKTVLFYIQGLIAQNAVKWSRFLGELYNYECIGRKQFFENLKEILSKGYQSSTISIAIKCVCSALQTSKNYLQMNNLKKQRQIMLMLLQMKCFYVKYKVVIEYALAFQIEEILQYFNPQLLKTLSSEEELRRFMSLCNNFINITNNKISYYITQLVHGCKLQNLRFIDQMPFTEPKIKYKQKESSEKKDKSWVQKSQPQRKPKYVQKQQQVEPELKSKSDFQQKSKQSQVTVQTIVSNGVPKKMKLIARSKKDNKLKTVTYNYLDMQSKPQQPLLYQTLQQLSQQLVLSASQPSPELPSQN